MDPTKLLEADHRQVEELFDRIQKADRSGRAALDRGVGDGASKRTCSSRRRSSIRR